MAPKSNLCLLGPGPNSAWNVTEIIPVGLREKKHNLFGRSDKYTLICRFYLEAVAVTQVCSLDKVAMFQFVLLSFKLNPLETCWLFISLAAAFGTGWFHWQIWQTFSLQVIAYAFLKMDILLFACLIFSPFEQWLMTTFLYSSLIRLVITIIAKYINDCNHNV